MSDERDGGGGVEGTEDGNGGGRGDGGGTRDDGGSGEGSDGDEAARSRAGDEPRGNEVDDGRDGTNDVDAPRVRETARGTRDVVVPMRLYKTVTTYATLTAVACVVFGFVLLDAATLQFSVLRSLAVGVLAAAGVTPPEQLLSGLFAVAGLAVIAFGAGVYVLGTRFRAAGMGNAQGGENER